jgi:hypothetical protein
MQILLGDAGAVDELVARCNNKPDRQPLSLTAGLLTAPLRKCCMMKREKLVSLQLVAHYSRLSKRVPRRACIQREKCRVHP